MSTRATRTPSIPNPSKDNVVEAVGSIKDLLDVREGRSGDPLDANVTYRDLQALGLAATPASLSSVAGTIPATGRPVVVPPWVNPVPWGGDNYDPNTDLSTPPPPANLIASGAYSSISLTWTFATYRNHAYTEVYRSAVNDLTKAVLIGTNPAAMFNDPVGTEQAYYYWVRNVSMANVRSEFNSASGAYAATALDVSRRIAEVEQKVIGDPLAQQLQSRVTRLEDAGYLTSSDFGVFRREIVDTNNGYAATMRVLRAGVASVSAGIVNVEQTKIGYATLNATGLAFDNNGAITNKADVIAWNTANPTNQATWNPGLPLATAVKQVGVSDGATTLTLEQRFTAQKTTNSNLEAQYTVKIDNNGFVSGFGLASSAVNGTPFSSFIVNADRFAVLNPNGTTYAISSLTRSSTTATLVYTGAAGVFSAGGTVTITGVADGLWNGTFTLLSASGNTLTFTVSASAAATATAATGMTMKVAASTVPFVVDGGITYINSAAILDASINEAKIASLNADKITTGNLTATLRVTTGEIASGPFGQAGFFLGNDGGTQKLYVGNGVNKYLQWDGNNLSVRGTVYAENGAFNGYIWSNSGFIGGNTITSEGIASPEYVANTSGWAINSDGTAEFGAASIRGQVTASQINANGLTITDGAGAPLLVSGTGLRFGIGSNLIPNADFLDGTGMLAVAYYTTASAPTLGANATSYIITGSSVAYMTVAGSTTSAQVFSVQIKNGVRLRFPVVTGKRYEFSALLNVTNCKAYIGIVWYDSAGTVLSETTTGYYTKTGALTTYADMDQAVLFATAPASAATAFLYVRGESTGLSNPYVYFTRVQFCEAGSAQTDPTPWSPGRGIGQITTDNASTYIANLAVDTLQIAGNAVTFPVVNAVNSYQEVSTNNSSVWTEVCAVTIDLGGSSAGVLSNLVMISYRPKNFSGGAWNTYYEVRNLAGTVQYSGVGGVANNADAVAMTSFGLVTGVSGSNTYKLFVRNAGDILGVTDPAGYPPNTYYSGVEQARMAVLGAKR